MARILGMNRGEYLRSFDRINLCSGEWDDRAARIRAVRVMARSSPRVLVLLGGRVQRAFESRGRPFSVDLVEGVRWAADIRGRRAASPQRPVQGVERRLLFWFGACRIAAELTRRATARLNFSGAARLVERPAVNREAAGSSPAPRASLTKEVGR